MASESQTTEDTVTLDCQQCGGDGRRITSRWEWDDTDLGPCWACSGTGRIEVELQPIEMEDLERAE